MAFLNVTLSVTYVYAPKNNITFSDLCESLDLQGWWQKKPKLEV